MPNQAHFFFRFLARLITINNRLIEPSSRTQVRGENAWALGWCYNMFPFIVYVCRVIEIQPLNMTFVSKKCNKRSLASIGRYLICQWKNAGPWNEIWNHAKIVKLCLNHDCVSWLVRFKSFAFRKLTTVNTESNLKFAVKHYPQSGDLCSTNTIFISDWKKRCRRKNINRERWDSGIPGTSQSKLFNYTNKDLFHCKTLLENVFYYSVFVMIIWNLANFITKSSFFIPIEPLGRNVHSLSFLCDNVYSISYIQTLKLTITNRTPS